MGQPITTNPLLILIINMTVVFGVLYGLALVIKFISVIDPTKKKEEQEEVVVEPQAEMVAAVEEGLNPEIVAVIAAAIAAYGYSQGQIRAIRRLDSHDWKNAGLVANQRSS